MPDPLNALDDAEQRTQLERIRNLIGETVSSSRLQSEIQGFQSQKGIYKPAGQEYALWVRQTRNGPYPDKDPIEHPDGSWTYRYSPEGRNGATDLGLATNRGLLKCQKDRVPVGVFRQRPDGSSGTEYEVMGLAYVESFDGEYFVLRGEPIDWTAAPVPETVVPTFSPFESVAPKSESISRLIRDHRFGVALRRVYRGRCGLCDVGYRLRGRSIGVDAAHIIPIESNGVIGDIRNGILLCKNHHALFDGMAWTFDEDLRVVISHDADFRETAAANHVLKFDGTRLADLPERDEDLPAAAAIRWRMSEFEKAWA